MTTRKFPELLMGTEVATIFRVDARTVMRWAKQGKLRSIRTLSTGEGPGHRRYFRAEIDALVAGKPLTEAQLDALVRGDL